MEDIGLLDALRGEGMGGGREGGRYSESCWGSSAYREKENVGETIGC